MIKVSPQAQKEILKTVADAPGSKVVRIFVAGYGWGGPSLGLALDEQQETDKVEQCDGFQVVINEQLFKDCGGVRIDLISSPWLGERLQVSAVYSRACWFKPASFQLNEWGSRREKLFFEIEGFPFFGDHHGIAGDHEFDLFLGFVG